MSSPAVDPHTAVIIVVTTLPGLFCIFVAVGMAVWWRRRRFARAQRRLRADNAAAAGEAGPGDYERWLQTLHRHSGDDDDGDDPPGRGTDSYELEMRGAPQPAVAKKVEAQVEERAI